MNNKQKAQERIDQIKLEMVELEKILEEEDVIYVPDEIEFEDIGSSGLLALRFDGNGCLYYSNLAKRFLVNEFIKEDRSRCKLTPIKYEDIKVGDWVYVRWNKEPVDPLLRYRYLLSVGNNRFIFIGGNLDILRATLSRDYEFLKVEKV